MRDCSAVDLNPRAALTELCVELENRFSPRLQAIDSPDERGNTNRSRLHT